MPTADANMAHMFLNTAFGGRFPANLNNQMFLGLGAGNAPLGAAAGIPTTNGKPAYAFKMSPGESMMPVQFPADASHGADVPKSLKRIGDLPHGDVVCAVTMAQNGRHVFTGGKGAVKIGDGVRLWTGGLDNSVRCWDIGERAELNKYTLESQIFSLGCCPTEDWVAVGMENNNVEEKYVLDDHQSCVLSLKFAHSGKWFVSTGKDNVVNCWRTPYGYRLLRSRENGSVLSCDISSDDRFLLTGSGDKKASLYELSF
uniref:WD_REPEATS_REGION domain-containing protein n=1 Tax=Globodera pallida TaxID=36090 RepID=A0A183C120_GLOPA